MIGGEPAPVSSREVALDAYRHFSNLLDTKGAEVFFAGVRAARLAAIEPDEGILDPVSLAAFAVEYDRIGAQVRSPELTEIRPDMLQWPVEAADLGATGETMDGMVDSFMPSRAFAEAIDPESYLAMGLSESGQMTHGDTALALLPIVDALLKRQGITDTQELIRLNRLSGARLFSELALSQEGFEEFSSAVGSFAPMSELDEDEAKANLAFYDPENDLAEAFGHFFEVYVDPKGNTHILWNEETTVRNGGCPMTMIEGNPFRPLWDGVVDLAAHAGFWQPPVSE